MMDPNSWELSKDFVRNIVTDLVALREKSTPVTPEEAEGIVKSLVTTLKDHPESVGLSAIQIGIPKRVFVLRNQTLDENDKLTIEYIPFINPTITDAYDPIMYASEGCLSFPGKFAATQRFKYCQIQDVERSRVLSGVLAIAAQHECDHLEGILFTDRIYRGVRKEKEIGRNDPCPCGSGKKWKKCCMNKEKK